MAKKKTSSRKTGKRSGARKARGKKKSARTSARSERQRARKNQRARRANLSRGLDSGSAQVIAESEPERSMAAGQSGDIENLSAIEDADSESVQELAEEGQDYEAEIVEGVERASDQPGRRMRVRRDEEPRPRPKRETL